MRWQHQGRIKHRGAGLVGRPRRGKSDARLAPRHGHITAFEFENELFRRGHEPAQHLLPVDRVPRRASVVILAARNRRGGDPRLGERGGADSLQFLDKVDQGPGSRRRPVIIATARHARGQAGLAESTVQPPEHSAVAELTPLWAEVICIADRAGVVVRGDQQVICVRYSVRRRLEQVAATVFQEA